jgi:hypothetical protein
MASTLMFNNHDRVLYTIDIDGRLHWQRYVGPSGLGRWALGSRRVISSVDWRQFTKVFSGGGGVIYAVKGGDLHRYVYTGDGSTDTWSSGSGAVVGEGGWDQFLFLCAGPDGVIYAVRTGGDLLWYRYDGERWTDDSGRVIGEGGWDQFTEVFSDGMKTLYGCRASGEIVYFRHTGSGSWADGSGSVLVEHMEPNLALLADADGIFYYLAADGQLYWKMYAGTGCDPDAWSASRWLRIARFAWEQYRYAFSGGGGVLYGGLPGGSLLWHQYLGCDSQDLGAWASRTGNAIASAEWGETTQACGGRDGVIYAVDGRGDLRWYRYTGDGSTSTWATGSGGVIGKGGWNQFVSLFSDGDRTLYALLANGDLRRYRYNGDGTDGTEKWDKSSGTVIGSFPDSRLSADADGVIYVARSDGNLYWHRYTGSGWAEGSGSVIGQGGWGEASRLVGGGGGVIYAARPDGRLVYNRYTGGGTDGVDKWDRASGLVIAENGLSSVFDVARQYAPLVYLHPDDEYQPSSVEWFLDRVSMKYGDVAAVDDAAIASPVLVLEEVDEQSLVSQSHTVDGVTYDSGQGDEETGFLLDDAGAGATRRGEGTSAPCYVHVVQWERGYDVQYWFFYPYNGDAEYKDGVTSTDTAGHHVGDWEHVTARFDFDFILQQLYYAAHKTDEGVWKMAYQIAWDERRPVAYSALHTHASYSTEGEQARDTNIDDYTKKGPAWSTAGDLVFIGFYGSSSDEPTVLRDFAWYTGRWGQTNDVVASSPVGPNLKGIWKKRESGAWSQPFSPSAKYGEGAAPSVAIRADGLFVEVHESQGHDTLWCSVGRISVDHRFARRVEWLSPAAEYDSGKVPAVALNDKGVVVEVHKSENDNALFCRIGKLSASGVLTWGDSHKFEGRGVDPAVAMDNAGRVVVVYKDSARSELYYQTGHVSDGAITWHKKAKYAGDHYARTPAVALNNAGVVVALHAESDQNSRASLCYLVGALNGATIAWNTKQKYAADRLLPAIALDDDGRVLEMHRSQQGFTLHYRFGRVSGAELSFTSYYTFGEEGDAPAVALLGGDAAIQIHASASENTLWSSLALLDPASI